MNYNTTPTKRVIDGEDYHFHTAHPTKKEAEEIESFLKRKHPRKYGNGKVKITHDSDGNWRVWAKKWW